MCTALPPAMRLLLTTSTVTGFPSKSLRTTTIPNLNQSCLARRNSLSFSKPTVPSSLSLSVCNVPIFFFFFWFYMQWFFKMQNLWLFELWWIGFYAVLCVYKNGAHLCVLGFERWVLFVSFSFYSLKTLEEDVLFGYRFWDESIRYLNERFLKVEVYNGVPFLICFLMIVSCYINFNCIQNLFWLTFKIRD